MTDYQLREFITFCALGSLLEERGFDEDDLMTEAELAAVDALVKPFADTLSESDAEDLTIVTAKTLLRESIDRLLAVDAATSVEPEETE